MRKPTKTQSCERAHIMAVLASLAVSPIFVRGDDSVVNSAHDLSSFGPVSVRAASESEVCVFCHTPHNASPAAPLWNRHNPRSYYRIYSSRTTQARVDQPGAPSKMCLSCHDGSIALGMVLNRAPNDPIHMTQSFLPSGPGNLTNDLSDDHPIGFRYDRQLANRDEQLRVPDLVSRQIKLGPRGEMECTACHDPHNNRLGNFLRVPEREGALCVTCHDMNGWQTSTHALSLADVPATVTNGIQLPFRSMRDNGCSSCHLSHNAVQREQLLRAQSSELCIGCHNGITARDVLVAQGRRSGHKPDRLRSNIHDPSEDPRFMRPHVECVDCHNPHAVKADSLASGFSRTRGAGPTAPPAMQFVPGVSLAGLPVDRSRFEYEVCFRCHADNPAPIRDRIVRQRDDGGNIRRLFQPTAASAHPLTFAARLGGESPSLRPEFRNQPYMSCQDCHNNPDARELGGSGANGPHGSRYDWLLVDRYETQDFTAESPQNYALCYRCHDRNSILGDESFSFHRLHVVNERSPCSACHAPHGVSGSRTNHDHLINFDVSIVQGERLFIDRGALSGSCTLTCHGVRHVNFVYGPTMR